MSKQISHATDSSTLGLAAGINNHHTHIVSYASLEMDFWKWHPEGCLSVNAPFKHGKCSRLAFLKNETVATARCNSSRLLVLWEPKGECGGLSSPSEPPASSAGGSLGRRFSAKRKLDQKSLKEGC